MLESLEIDTDKESFDKMLELLIKNCENKLKNCENKLKKVKTSCYVNKTYLSIPSEDQTNNTHGR